MIGVKPLFLGGCAKILSVHGAFVLFCLLLALSGCARFPASSPEHLQTLVLSDSVFMLVYHPYGPGLVRETNAPLPDYEGWTDNRMERDFSRMSDAGVDVVLVEVEVSTLHDAVRRQRYARLLELRAQNPGWPDIAFFMVLPHDADSGRPWSLEIPGWLLDLRLAWRPGVYRIDNRPLIVLANFGFRRIRHPAFFFIGAGDSPHSRNDWIWRPTNRDPVSVSRDGEQVWVSKISPADDLAGGLRGVFRRREDDGDAVVGALRQAAALEPKYFVINSWNNFADASYLEPSRDKGYSASRALRREIARLRSPQAGK